jgi:peptidoglycan/xylan/chitin deacetylase (PgdA/CDA1 family)
MKEKIKKINYILITILGILTITALVLISLIKQEEFKEVVNVKEQEQAEVVSKENKTEELNEIYPRFLITEACQGIAQRMTTERIIALTFDDGPNREYTKEILSILENYNIKATFL